jgi:nitrate reductase gamma subunit
MKLTETIFSYGPYLAVFAFAGAWLYRWGILRNQTAAPADEVRPEAEGALVLGFATLVVGHLTTALAPGAMRALLADPGRVTVIETVGMVGALLFAFGVGARLLTRVRALRSGRLRQGPVVLILSLLFLVCLSGLFLTVTYRWITVWYAYIFAPYLRSLAATDPVTASIVASPFAVKVHALLVMALGALWPMAGVGLDEIFPLRAVARRYAMRGEADAAKRAALAGEPR